ncbi:hypothetical protein GCM10023195_20160 [Actinoallomurus liliacearum]|uniref:Uncharacterized protein n=1 Tax=Actinoallomurus liliacearum TaxID=1080073 RepID=A0ABP8TGC6_9ACTN
MRSEAEKAALATVLRRWRSGGRLLTGYLVVVALAFPLFAGWDHRFSDLIKVAGVMTAVGVALLVLVGVRNGWAGDTLAEWRPELAPPRTRGEAAPERHRLAGVPGGAASDGRYTDQGLPWLSLPGRYWATKALQRRGR